ncbi:MAG: redoxin domain-containing protein, partial [Desulfobulbaceae bacterium]|nr:redoxin domain-containing protein [Desulfobulbaceae bacterium]
DMDGKTVDLKDSIGKKPIMLIFWASWCPNCKTEVPKINEQVGKYAVKGMEFIGINVGFNDSEARARSFMDKTGMSYPVVFDKTGKLSQQYRVQGVPTIIIADKKGTVAFKNFGVPELTDEKFKQLNNGH